MSGTANYKLLRGRKFISGRWYTAGDIVPLTESQAMNLRLSIEPVTTDDTSDTSGFYQPINEVTNVDFDDSSIGDVESDEDSGVFSTAEFKTTLAEVEVDEDEDGDEDLDDEE